MKKKLFIVQKFTTQDTRIVVQLQYCAKHRVHQESKKLDGCTTIKKQK